MSRSPRQRLDDALGAIEAARIADARLKECHQAGDRDGVRIAFDAILHDLFVIGEAIKALPAHLLESEPDVPWADVKGMRDVIGHAYHRIVPSIVHATVAQDLVLVESAIVRLITRLDAKE